MSKKEIDIDFVEKMALKTLHPEILRDAKVFASGNVLDGKYDGFERFQIAKHNFLYGAMAAKALDKKIKENANKRELNLKNDVEPLSIPRVSQRRELLAFAKELQNIGFNAMDDAEKVVDIYLKANCG